VGYSQGRSR